MMGAQLHQTLLYLRNTSLLLCIAFITLPVED
jgi:hypothetical protein